MNHPAGKQRPNQTESHLWEQFCLEAFAENDRFQVGHRLKIKTILNYWSTAGTLTMILTVNDRMNSQEPRNPPKTVAIWEEAINGLYICIAEKINTAVTEARTNDTEVGTASVNR